MKKPTVIIIDNSLDTTGAFKAILNYCLELRNNFNFVFVIPINSITHTQLFENDFSYYRIPMVELSRRIVDLILYLPCLLVNGWKLRTLVKQHHVEIVHVNDIYNLVGVIARCLYRFKLITHVRSMPERFPAILWKLWVNLHNLTSSKIICVSKAVLNCVSAANSVLIYDYIALPEELPKKVIVKTDEVKLLYLSNYVKGKGQDDAIESFYLAYQENPKLRLCFFGGYLETSKNKIYKSTLQKRVNDLGLDTVIEFNEFTNDIEREIKRADILLSFSESESLSFVCIEAMGYGTPVICAINGGTSDYIEDGKNGLLIRKGDCSQMKTAILRLTNDIGLRKIFSIEGKKTIQLFFNKSNTIELLKVVYQELTKNATLCD